VQHLCFDHEKQARQSKLQVDSKSEGRSAPIAMM
jgi:hypothetical protein